VVADDEDELCSAEQDESTLGEHAQGCPPKASKGKIGHFWVLSVKQGTHELTALLSFFPSNIFSAYDENWKVVCYPLLSH